MPSVRQKAAIRMGAALFWCRNALHAGFLGAGGTVVQSVQLA